jgi:hypothetical protein
MNDRSPTPWRIENGLHRDPTGQSGASWHVYDANGSYVCSFSGTPTAPTNAKRIVRAVNCHAELVAVAETCLLSMVIIQSRSPSVMNKEIEELNAILAKARA